MWKKVFSVKNSVYFLCIIILIPVVSYSSVQVSVLFGRSIDHFSDANGFTRYVILLAITSFIAYFSEKICLLFIEDKLSNNVIIALHNLTIRKMYHIEYGRFSQWSKSDLFQMLSKDIYDIKNVSFRGFIRLTIGVITGIIAAIELANIYFIFPMIAGTIYFLSLLIVRPLSRLSKKYSDDVRNNEKAITSNFMGILDHFELVKIFGRSEQEIDKLEKANNDYNSSIIKSKITTNFYKTLNRVTNAVAPVAIVLVGSWQYKSGNITIGQLIAAVGLLASICYPIQSFGEIVIQMKAVWFKFTNIIKFLNEPNEPLVSNAKNNEFSGDIEFKDVNYQVNGISVLNRISFRIPYGKSTAIIGQTGSGKSTIANLISGLVKVSSGDIFFDDTIISDKNRALLRHSISYIHSSTFFIHDSLMNNLKLCHPQENRLNAISASLGVNDIVNSLTDGYQTILGPNGQKLSGGQEKRIGMVRGLAVNRNYYLLDEVTTALDEKASAQVMEFLHKDMDGKTMIVITHDLSGIQEFDNIIMIDKGCICGEGSHAELYQNCEKYRELYHGKK